MFEVTRAVTNIPRLPRLAALTLAAALAVGAGGCGGKGGGTQTTQTSSPLCASDPGPAPLRRMTRFEYGRTIAALTGVDASVAETLPPDEETLDFDDIASAYSVSSLHAADYLQVAEQAAAALVADSARLAAYAGCDPTAGDATCLGGFVAAFGRKAWRRPLTADESQAMLAVFTATADPQSADGVAGVVATMLQVPQFLYRPEIGDPAATALAPLDGYALGTRLSYLLTGAGPDDELLSAAGAGKLATEAGLLAETDRLLADPRSADLFVHFANEWWQIEALPTLDKDRTLFRIWTDDTPGALGQETTAFLTDAWKNGPTLPALLTSPVTFLDASLATYYGLPAPAGDGYQKVALDPTRAAGMLTQGSFLAMHAEAQQTSPTLRGRFIRAQLFCTPPPPPPPSVIVSPPVVDPSKSTRERFAEHTTNAFCANCHNLMDPIGFAFENYDAAGRWRDTDSDQPVDATGALTGTDVDATLDGVPSLAKQLAASAEVATCAATQWFRYAFGRSEQTAGDQCAIAALATALTGDGGDFKAMVRTTVRLAGFRTLPVETQP